MSTEPDTIVIKAPAGTKARWVRQARGQKLSNWALAAVARGAAAAPEPAQADGALSDAQFAALADLLRLRAGPAQDAARLVLVEGKSVSAAAIDTGLPYPRAWQAMQRAQRGLKLAHSVCGLRDDPA